MNQLDNCPQCGKLFVRGPFDVCRDCQKEIEDQYDACVKYLRENRAANLNQLSEATGVSVKQIIQFIRKGRLSISGNPNMGIPCESCGAAIRDGHLCETCRTRLTNQIGSTLNDERKSETERNQAAYRTQQRKLGR